MKIPNVAQAYVPESKIVDYLLSPTHPDGRSKAAFFASFGFHRDAWTELADALRRHAGAHDVVSAVDTQFGRKYRVEGPLPCPDGRNPNILAVWAIDFGSEIPRFVTAFPGRLTRADG